ncbi:MAG: hypothetical protein WC666_00970 [Candidatus Paceibacterota bacterium]|jgi:hypothetical protein
MTKSVTNNRITSWQLTQIYRIAENCGVSFVEAELLINSGLLSDLFSGDCKKVNREEFRKVIHFSPDTKPLPKVCMLQKEKEVVDLREIAEPTTSRRIIKTRQSL